MFTLATEFRESATKNLQDRLRAISAIGALVFLPAHQGKAEREKTLESVAMCTATTYLNFPDKSDDDFPTSRRFVWKNLAIIQYGDQAAKNILESSIKLQKMNQQERSSTIQNCAQENPLERVSHPQVIEKFPKNLIDHANVCTNVYAFTEGHQRELGISDHNMTSFKRFSDNATYLKLSYRAMKMAEEKGEMDWTRFVFSRAYNEGQIFKDLEYCKSYYDKHMIIRSP